MARICQIADEQDIDLILIAGDVFDHFNPDTASVELFYQTLRKLTKGGTRPVIAIAGNHDSGERLSAPDPLARSMGIFLVGQPFGPSLRLRSGQATPLRDQKTSVLENGITVCDFNNGLLEISFENAGPSTALRDLGSGDGSTVRIIATPYTNEFRLKQALLEEDKEKELRQVLQSRWKALTELEGEADFNLLMTHLFVVKQGEALPEEPSDEKPILHVGGTQAVFTSNFPDKLDYAALGHLHGFREVGGKNYPICYASSPLQYSFGESGKTGQVVIVTLEKDQKTQVEPIALEVGKPLLRYNADGVSDALQWLQSHPDALVELTLKTEAFLTAKDRQTLHEAHEGIVQIIPELSHSTQSAVEGHYGSVETPDLTLSREELFYQYFENRHGQAASEDIKALFKEILNAEKS